MTFPELEPGRLVEPKGLPGRLIRVEKVEWCRDEWGKSLAMVHGTYLDGGASASWPSGMLRAAPPPKPKPRKPRKPSKK